MVSAGLSVKLITDTIYTIIIIRNNDSIKDEPNIKKIKYPGREV